MDYTEIARLHTIWRNMRSRCDNPKNKQYADYGGRGISIDASWYDFNMFCQWCLDHGSSSRLQLDRRDNDGPYGPDNCRFITPKANARNKRNNFWITAWGETKNLTAWEEDPRCVTNRSALSRRIKAGWAPEEAISVLRASLLESRVCPQGHRMTRENTYWRKKGGRLCRQCALDRNKEKQ